MRNEDRLMDMLEAAEIQRYAKLQRRHLGWESLDRVDPLSIATVTEIWTVRGMTPFRLEFVEDDGLQNARGRAKYDGSTLIVRIPERIRCGAFVGDGYARFQVAEQIGHATLRHPEVPSLIAKFRRYQEEGVEDARAVVAAGSKSAEFQAGVFAAALLINEDKAREIASIEELSIQFGIDTLTARVYYHELQSGISQRSSIFPAFGRSTKEL